MSCPIVKACQQKKTNQGAQTLSVTLIIVTSVIKSKRKEKGKK